MRKPVFAYAKIKAQISFAVTAKLISAFVFATQIVQSLFFLNPKFQVSSHLLWLYSPVCVGPGQKTLKPVFSQRGSNSINHGSLIPSFNRENCDWFRCYTSRFMRNLIFEVSDQVRHKLGCATSEDG